MKNKSNQELFNRKLIPIFTLFIALLLLSINNYSQPKPEPGENERTFNNFYWGNKLRDKNGNWLYAEENLYDLLTNELIGNINSTVSYYYIPEACEAPQYANNVTINWNNKISNIFLSYKFKNLENALRWAKGDRYMPVGQSKKEESKGAFSFFSSKEKDKKSKNAEPEKNNLLQLEKELEDFKKSIKNKKYSGYLAGEDRKSDASWLNELQVRVRMEKERIENSTPHLVNTELFGTYLPNLNNLVLYYNQHKQEILNTKQTISQIASKYEGSSPDSNVFSIQNLMDKYLIAEKTAGEEQKKDAIYQMITNFVYKGTHPDPKDYIALQKKEKTYSSNVIYSQDKSRYVYLKEVGLFVTMDDLNGGRVKIFDPINGPLFFARNVNGFKLYNNQFEPISISFNDVSDIYSYRPKTNYYEKPKRYYVGTGVGVYNKIGLEFGIEDDGRFTIWQGDALTFLEYDNIDRTNNNYYIATNQFSETYTYTFKDYPSQYSKTLMAQAGSISVQQAADPNFYINIQKEGTRISDKKEVTILNTNGYAVTPTYDDITQVKDNFFKVRKNNRFGLIYLTAETIKKNNYVLIPPLAGQLNISVEAENLKVTTGAASNNASPDRASRIMGDTTGRIRPIMNRTGSSLAHEYVFDFNGVQLSAQ